MPYDENGDWIDDQETPQENQQEPGEEASPYDQFPARPYTDQEVGQPVSQIVPPSDPNQPAQPVQPYQGQAFPGLPVIVDQGAGPGGSNQYTYNGRIVPTEQAAFQARAQDAANPQSQQAYAQAQAALPQRQAGDPGEMTSIQLRAEMDRNSLSRADQVELAQLQNGVARVQADAREGRVPTAQAIQIERELRARMEPKMITLERFHGLQQTLAYRLNQERLQQMSHLNTQANLFTAAHAPGTTIPFRDPATGRVHAQGFIDGQGHMHVVNVPPPPVERAPGRDPSQLTPQALNQIHHQIEEQVRHEMNPSGGRTFEVPDSFVTIPGESREARRDRYAEDRTQRLVDARIRRMGGPAGGSTASDQEQALQGLATGILGRIFPGGGGSPQAAPPSSGLRPADMTGVSIAGQPRPLGFPPTSGE